MTPMPVMQKMIWFRNTPSMLSFTFVYWLQARGSNCFRKNSLPFLSRTFWSLFPFWMFKWHLEAVRHKARKKGFPNVLAKLTSSGSLVYCLIQQMFQCQDNMFSLITQTIVCLDTLQDQTQTDCPPLPLSLPHGQLGWICTGAQMQCSVKCNCSVYFPSCVFVQKKYVNVYACTAAEKVGLPFPAVLMQGLLFF